MRNKGPSIFTTIGKSYCRSFLKPTPIWVHLYVTRHCNFSCFYCGARDNNRKDPSFEEVCTMILNLKKIGCNCIALMGGEPTLRRDIVRIVEFCSKNNIYTQLSTNGSFLVHSSCCENGQTLLSNLVSAGLGTINLSVDSVASNFSVSEKKLPKAKQVLEALIKEKEKRELTVMLNCVISKKNIAQVPKMLEFCKNKGIMLAAIFVQNPNPQKEIEKGSYLEKILFSEKDAKMVCQLADFLIKRKRERYSLLEPIAYYEAVKQWVKNDYSWSCGGGKYSLEIDTDGKVGICGYLPYLDLNILKVGSDFFDKIETARKNCKEWCTKRCLPSCMFCSAYYYQNPINFLLSKWGYA